MVKELDGDVTFGLAAEIVIPPTTVIISMLSTIQNVLVTLKRRKIDDILSMGHEQKSMVVLYRQVTLLTSGLKRPIAVEIAISP